MLLDASPSASPSPAPFPVSNDVSISSRVEFEGLSRRSREAAAGAAQRFVNVRATQKVRERERSSEREQGGASYTKEKLRLRFALWLRFGGFPSRFSFAFWVSFQFWFRFRFFFCICICVWQAGRVVISVVSAFLLPAFFLAFLACFFGSAESWRNA